MSESLLRTATLVVLTLVVGAILAVMRLHHRAWRRLPREAGLTPLHVMLVSLGVLIWGTTLAWAQIDALSGEPDLVRVAIRTWLFLVGAVVILVALVVVGGLQRRRVRFERSETLVVSSEDAVITSANRLGRRRW